jgi:acetate kinase
MRQLHEAATSNANARLAIAMFCYSVRKQIAGMIAALNGADLVVLGSASISTKIGIDQRTIHQQFQIALRGAGPRIAGGRADRPPCTKIVRAENFRITSSALN